MFSLSYIFSSTHLFDYLFQQFKHSPKSQFNYNGTTGYLYKNNSLLQSTNITLNALNTGKLYIGNATEGATPEYANANIQECIAWTSNQDANRTGISTNINTGIINARTPNDDSVMGIM